MKKLAMFLLIVPLLAWATAFLVAFVPAANASVITWGTAQNTSAPGDVSTNGVLVEAINATSDNFLPGSTTVNGVTFTNSDVLPASSGSENFLAGNMTGDAGYDLLLSTLDLGGGTSTSIFVGAGALLIDSLYEIQVWLTDLRLGIPRTMLYGDGNGNTVSLTSDTGDFGQFAIGTFVADAAIQELTITTPDANNAHITAYQVRQLATVPEPSTLTLLTIGLVGLGWMGRRRRKSL